MRRWKKGKTTELGNNRLLTEFDLVKTHEDSGRYCTVGHMDGKGNTLPECTWCDECKQWIRPEDMDNECQVSIEHKES